MSMLRAWLRDRAGVAALVVAAALLLRVLVPAGYMPSLSHGRIVLTLCPGAMPAKAHNGMHGMQHHEEAPAAEAKGCAFADLALPALGGVDPILLADAILFILAVALFLAPALPPRSARHLRPPLRGPPLPA